MVDIKGEVVAEEVAVAVEEVAGTEIGVALMPGIGFFLRICYTFSAH